MSAIDTAEFRKRLRIDDGTLGICEVCGDPVGAKRLSALPWARLCIDDKRRADG